ncbi:caspase-10-like [Engraulis encrasicolus]|uniref:caspase-10-like n=1 Tax=Engraulis encrasicolus TaxID=184585 RepID=UPI002FCF6EE9
MEPHKRFIRSNKPKLIKVLCTDASFILQHVEGKELITEREYNNLIPNSDTRGEKVTIDLLDKLMNKGDQHCKEFIALLGEDETLQTFPALKEILPPPTAPQQVAVRTPGTDTPVQEAGLVKTYAMIQSPRGLCVIINNVNFEKSTERRGSDTDADTLEQVFHWLGFTVERHRNKTVAEMKAVLQECSQKAVGDCFICCVLSHGKSEGILGHDDDIEENS